MARFESYPIIRDGAAQFQLRNSTESITKAGQQKLAEMVEALLGTVEVSPEVKQYYRQLTAKQRPEHLESNLKFISERISRVPPLFLTVQARIEPGNSPQYELKKRW